MKRAQSSSGFLGARWRRTSAILPAGALLAGAWVVAGAWAAASNWDVHTLQASDVEVLDTDRDGLPDRQEKVLGTHLLLVDTDGDGFSDGEEVALQTSPLDFDSVPAASELSVGMSARGESGKLKMFVVVLAPDGVLTNKNLRFGALINGRIGRMPIPLSAYSDPDLAPGLNGGVLFSLNIDLPDAVFQVSRTITYFVAVGKVGDPSYVAAAKIDLSLEQHGVVMLRHVLSEPGEPPGDPNAQPTAGASLRFPIPPNGDNAIPVDWKFGEVCYQQSQIVGASGAVVTHEVSAAECVEGWETYCEAECSNTAGSTYETIDTGALLGG